MCTKEDYAIGLSSIKLYDKREIGFTNHLSAFSPPFMFYGEVVLLCDIKSQKLHSLAFQHQNGPLVLFDCVYSLAFFHLSCHLGSGSCYAGAWCLRMSSFYNKVKSEQSCTHKLQEGFYSQEGGNQYECASASYLECNIVIWHGR